MWILSRQHPFRDHLKSVSGVKDAKNQSKLQKSAAHREMWANKILIQQKYFLLIFKTEILHLQSYLTKMNIIISNILEFYQIQIKKKRSITKL